MMLVALAVYRELGIGQFALNVNSVGCQRCRPPYKVLLVRELQKVRDKLSAESQARIDQNPLRVLDSKDKHDRELTSDVPLMKDHLCPECSEHFEEVKTLLQTTGTPFQINGRMVRGLDYYTKTAFEITSTALGSQDALAGGGRYDLLVEELGGKATPGVGFAAGMERLMMVLAKSGTLPSLETQPVLFIAANGIAAQQWAFAAAAKLRMRGFRTEIDYLQRSLKAQMREANRQQARYALVIGETELQANSANLKNMQTGEEKAVALDQLESALTM
jgi:histidyl-tRNA synthetase